MAFYVIRGPGRCADNWLVVRGAGAEQTLVAQHFDKRSALDEADELNSDNALDDLPCDMQELIGEIS